MLYQPRFATVKHRDALADAMVPRWMFPIALACGNTFILKPSERDPSASLSMAQLGGTLFDRVQPHTKIYREEIFGPRSAVCASRTSPTLGFGRSGNVVRPNKWTLPDR